MLAMTPATPVPGRNPALTAYRVLHDAVISGTLEPGSRLPGERALAEQLAVSRATVRQVLTALAEGGLLLSSANRGWFVAERRISEGPNVLRSFTQAALDRGLAPTAVVLHQGVRPATLDEAEVLGLAPAADVLDLRRARAMDGTPVSVESTCVALARVPGLESVDLTNCSLYQVLTERYGIIATRCDYEVQAEAASEAVGAVLRIAPGSPVLVGYQTTFDQSERPIDTGRVTYRGDAYRFKASLFRP